MTRLLPKPKSTARHDPLTVALLSSCLLHTLLVLGLMTANRTTELRVDNYQRVTLLDNPQTEEKLHTAKREVPAQTKKLATKNEPTKPKPPAKKDLVRRGPDVLPENSTHEEIHQKPEVVSPALGQPSSLSDAKPEAAGGQRGADFSTGNGDIPARSGVGLIGGGGGTAESGKDSGAPGSPAILKTNRQATLTQRARAFYPPMALRMGIEGDVTLRIEVNSEGQVTRAEIVKGAGSGFDEEALKAAKQSRFEPAQKDGRNVPAEFTYVYHFRLTR